MSGWLLDDLIVQGETIRGEGTCYYVDSLTPRGREIMRAFTGKTQFVGRGAKQQAEKALRLMLDAGLETPWASVTVTDTELGGTEIVHNDW